MDHDIPLYARLGSGDLYSLAHEVDPCGSEVSGALRTSPKWCQICHFMGQISRSEWSQNMRWGPEYMRYGPESMRSGGPWDPE